MEINTKNTKQRTAIFNAIRQADGPLSVTEILKQAQNDVPSLALATVYRTVSFLKRQNQIIQVDLPGSEPYFELTGRGHHHHFQCLTCNKVYELSTCPVDLKSLSNCQDFIVEDHHLTFYGRCLRCK